MPRSEGRYAVCDEQMHGARIDTGDHGCNVWGPRGECGKYDDFEEARMLSYATWKSHRGQHLIVVRDDADHGKIVHSRPPLPWVRSAWWLVSDRVRDVRRSIRSRVWWAGRRTREFFSKSWTVSHTLTGVTIAIALLGLYLAFIKPVVCVENHHNRCPCPSGDGWQVCRGGKYSVCQCPKP